MSTLIGFVGASDNTIEKAKSLNTLSSGESPFQNGVAFAVTSYSFVVSESYDFGTNKKSRGTRPLPVLVTDKLGNLFVKMLRDRYDIDGNLVEADGDLNKEFKRLKSKASNDGEILQGLVDFCKDKTLVVRRSKPFHFLNYNGQERIASIVNIDVKEGK